jgi:hypothetical protein
VGASHWEGWFDLVPSLRLNCFEKACCASCWLSSLVFFQRCHNLLLRHHMLYSGPKFKMRSCHSAC